MLFQLRSGQNGQEWSAGKIGMAGGSYLGWVQIYQYEIDAGVTANVFRRGHRIRLEVFSRLGGIDGDAGADWQAVSVVAGVCNLARKLVAKDKRELYVEAAVAAVMVVMHVSTADASSSQAHQHLVRVDRGHIHLLVSQVFGSVEEVCAHGGIAFLLLWLFLGAEPVHVTQFPSQATHLNQVFDRGVTLGAVIHTSGPGEWFGHTIYNVAGLGCTVGQLASLSATLDQDGSKPVHY